MADPNLKVVYSPLGERFEVTPANFRDLIKHAGWYEHPPHPDTVATHKDEGVTTVNANTPVTDDDADEAEEKSEETATETTDEANDADADQTEENDEEEEEGEALKTQPSEFADMDKQAVAAYIEKNFPDQQIDGRAGRDKLVALALELAAAKANA